MRNIKKILNIFCIALRKHAHAIFSDFTSCKNDNFQMKKIVIFIIFAQNVDCGYTLESVPAICVLERE